MQEIRILPLLGIPEINDGDDIALQIVQAVRKDSLVIDPGDVVVVAHKIVSKAEGRIKALPDVKPSSRAQRLANDLGKDPRLVELILRESRRIIRMERGLLISETYQGQICANAGIDLSNAQEEHAVLLPQDPDESARKIRKKIKSIVRADVAVIIADSFGRPWRVGQVNVAIGVSGMNPLTDHRGTMDSSHRQLRASILASADELAAAAELVMGKTENIPVALIKGFRYETKEGTGKDLLRPPEEDLFR